MPLYEYHCRTCERDAEMLVRSSSEKVICPACGANNMEKLISIPAAPAMGSRGLPMAGPGPADCGMPRCCGGGCQID